MNKWIKMQFFLLLLAGMVNTSFGQDDVVDYETYAKTNIAISKFKIVGVTQKQYAKCLQTENYFEPEKHLKFIVIDKTIFSDDGQGYDLKADDGILTSNQLYNYSGNSFLLPGDYKETTNHDQVIADELFNYRSPTEKIIIKCKFKWVKCKDLTNPAHQLTCQLAGWPFGGFELIECEVTWELPWF